VKGYSAPTRNGELCRRGAEVAAPEATGAAPRVAQVVCSSCVWYFPVLRGYTSEPEPLRCDECVRAKTAQ